MQLRRRQRGEERGGGSRRQRRQQAAKVGGAGGSPCTQQGAPTLPEQSTTRLKSSCVGGSNERSVLLSSMISRLKRTPCEKPARMGAVPTTTDLICNT